MKRRTYIVVAGLAAAWFGCSGDPALDASEQERFATVEKAALSPSRAVVAQLEVEGAEVRLTVRTAPPELEEVLTVEQLAPDARAFFDEDERLWVGTGAGWRCFAARDGDWQEQLPLPELPALGEKLAR